MLAGVVVAVTDDHDNSARLNGLTLHQFAAGAGQVYRIEERRASARFQLPDLVRQWFGIAGRVHRYFRILGIIDEIAGILRIARQEVLDQLNGSVLIILPMNAAGA